MRGKNPIRKPENGDGSILQVKHIFPTLQGEGPYAGHPAVFIRLGGCNLACDFCDTDFEDFAPMGLDEILEKVKKLSCHPRESGDPSKAASAAGKLLLDGSPLKPGMTKLVVLTGGEPFRQPIAPLCEHLIAAGFKIQIETNGTLWRELPPEVEIVCSPKHTGKTYSPIRPDLLARVNAFKFIVSAHREDYNHVGEVGQGDIPVYVQPMDEYDETRNRDNWALAAKLAATHGYRLSLQLHKLLGIE